jgi:hypothetical protein
MDIGCIGAARRAGNNNARQLDTTIIKVRMGNETKVIYRIHAIKRMVDRRISPEEVCRILETGVAIENYPDDLPFPSRLVVGTVGSRPLHVVVADNRQDGEMVIITVYEPDPDKWDDDFSRRKS